jgi:hypothetical protein
VRGLMDPADKVKLNKNNVVFGTCVTAGITAEKVVVVENTAWELEKGSIVYITFENVNTAENPTLKVNCKDAKPINFKTSLPYLLSNKLYGFIYDGTSYCLIEEFQNVEGQLQSYQLSSADSASTSAGRVGAEIFNSNTNAAIGKYAHAEGY